MANEIVSLLNNFWNRFCLIIKDCLVYPRKSIMFKSNDNCNGFEKIVLTEKIGFPDWPSKKYPEGKINIAKQNKKKQKIYASCAEILFFPNSLNDNLKAFLLRFDYHPWEGSGAGDPLFHVQMNSKPLPLSWLPESLQKKWPSDCPEIESKYINYLRIPTPRMLFPDLIYFLVADHLRKVVHNLVSGTNEYFKEFKKYMHDEDMGIENKFWDFNHTAYWYRIIKRK